MNWSAVALVTFSVGTLGNSVKAIPQIVRTAVRGQVAGLSTTAVWLSFTANVLWLSFGLAIQDWRFAALGVAQTVLTGQGPGKVALWGVSRGDTPVRV